ncbi:phosphodiesterase [Sphaerisporangium krabiense]|uniref:Putative AlkP superfamily phosphohydrolase/phosphomutase n=1 Tax=Sphaerisporangium krabiense TaxID=763782 RepID=A0A7W9DRS7_9ACTN|nr:alkaline phosphatase family protein [Sphaerisporangium krabiense]MBB5628434.1 putative AlkP superfamily phosphohydrolase/phosphomutase [Sphaerisporangium krabiense]GII66827.1 phosphodiesterase [Sphaerisporangium krabiense]
MTGRMLVVGLDGMPLDLLHGLAGAGIMPAARRLLAEGRSVELRAPVPEVSSTSWASFLTGANPARHGVYGFVDLLPGGYQTYFPNVTHLRAPPLWEQAAGRRTLCLNVPGTYPAPETGGVVVSGFVAPSFDRAVRPARLLEPLRLRGYRLDVEVGDVAADPRAFIGRVSAALAARALSFEYLLDTEPWDLAIAVITETDRLQHFLWRHVTDEASPLHEAVLGVYAQVDACLARLVERCEEDDGIALVSDHGFGPADCQFHVNAWLREKGHLAAREDTPALAEVDERTSVFALDPARLYLNRPGRFPRGRAGLGDAFAEELAVELTSLRWEGRPVVERVYRREEVYRGPLLDLAPDLVVMPAPGVQLRGAFGADAVVRPDVFTGTHTRGNAVFYLRGGDAALPDPMDMEDVAPVLLGRLGVPAAVPVGGRG